MANNRMRINRRLPPLLALALTGALLAGCMQSGWSPAASPAAPSPSGTARDGGPEPAVSEPPPEPEPPKEITTEATLMAAGDIMVHMPQLPAYYDAASDKYDFRPWFRYVEPMFRDGDWVVGNLETPLAGADLKYTGFPRFNAPPELAYALREAGFDLVSTANNHAMDRGFAGIQRTLRNVREAGLIPFGTYETPEDASAPLIVERNGIHMGFLSYTYGTNGIPLPEDKPFAVNLIRPDNMAEDIRRLREAGSDMVTVSLHFGTEYQRLPNEEQVRIVRSAVASGADIVLGSHPHVVQPYDIVEIPAAESPLGKDRKGVVIYSLGNFISNQTGNWKDVGLIFSVHIRKTERPDGTSLTVWDGIALHPTWVHIERKNNKRHYSILPLRLDWTGQDQEPALTPEERKNMKSMLEGITAHLETYQK